MNMQVLDARRDVGGGYKVDVSRGQRIGRVSSEWFSRPDDERFLSLGDLACSVRGRSERSRTRVVESALIHVEANRNDPERLALILPGTDAPVMPTHWSFGQLASQVGAPAAYLRQLPAPLAAINLQYGLTSHRAEQIKTLETDNGRLELRAVTGPDYGRIYDHELVEAVQKIAGNGTGDTRWKVPGVLDWSTGVYNPRVDITRTRPRFTPRTVMCSCSWSTISIRSKPDDCPTGRPISTSAGSTAGTPRLGLKRLAWRASTCARFARTGTSGAWRTSRKSASATASMRRTDFAHEAAPALEGFANSSPQPFVNGIKAARERIVARTDEDRSDFLRNRGFSKAETGKIIETVLAEEGRPPESIFDFVQGITALARDKAHQDARLDMEGKAKKLLDRVH
jgi:hypothetical protein